MRLNDRTDSTTVLFSQSSLSMRSVLQNKTNKQTQKKKKKNAAFSLRIWVDTGRCFRQTTVKFRYYDHLKLRRLVY